MNKPQSLNLFLFNNSEARALGSVQTSPVIRVLRPASFALWFIVVVAQVIALVGTGTTDGILFVALATLLFFGVHVQFWYEESDQGRRFHHALQRARGRVYEDDATGLPNSRHFVFELRRQMTRSMRNGKGFAIVLTDVTGAEKLKSQDRMLMSAGRNLRQALGDGDFVARLQGPIFGAIVLDEREQSATQKAEGLVAALGAAIPVAEAGSLVPVVAVTGYEGEVEVRDFLRRSQRELHSARERAAGPLYNDPERVLGAA